MFKDGKSIILSLGGSLIYPEKGLNNNFLKKFDRFIRKHVSLGKRFFIVCGGGFICRKYQKAVLKVVDKITNDDVDWLGIHSTRINAHLIRTIFQDLAHPRVIDQYEKKENINEPVVVVAGWKPGWSTDFCAATLAKEYGAKIMVNMSNVKMVYDKDPRKFKKTKPIKSWNWKEYRKLAGDDWIPGMNLPFDPIAAKLADEIGLKVIILKGDDLANLEKVFLGKKFVGTLIE